MNEQTLQTLLRGQRAYFDAGHTLPVSARLEALERLKTALQRREGEALAALRADLGKSPEEGYLCEAGMVYSELSYLQRHLRQLAKRRPVPTPLAQFAARSYVQPSPKGVVLIMSPWNYPLMLTLDPLADALAAGNTAVLKPSAYAPRTAEFLTSLVAECFDPGLVCLVTGGREENRQLLDQPFDHIFFTGSQAVGREVLRHAAERLTPCTLELGGKSPCIVDKTANISVTARRIVFGKFLNCGQTCVAPDYILCDEALRPALVEALEKEILRQFGPRPLDNPAYGRIINEKHFRRLTGLLEGAPVVFGGETEPDRCRIAPTLLDPVSWEDPVMQEEIFGPLLPILTYTDLNAAVAEIRKRPHPLALYLFSEDRPTIRRITESVEFGGGCINDTIIHLATSAMGFGGAGASGLGAYHGKRGFDEFSHLKSIVDKKTWLDLPMRYQPYTKVNGKLVRFFLR